MSIAIEIDATVDEAGTKTMPKIIGPFPTADAARVYMGAMFPRLWGTWSLTFMESPDYAARLSTRDSQTSGSQS